MLISDNIKTRGLRENIFNPKLKVMGVACGPHKDKGSVTVVDFTSKELAKGEMPTIHVQNVGDVPTEQRRKLKEAGYTGEIREPAKKTTTKLGMKTRVSADSGTKSRLKPAVVSFYGIHYDNRPNRFQLLKRILKNYQEWVLHKQLER
jgi:hypothetical protein